MNRMTVKQLIQELEQLPPDMTLLAYDSSGDGYLDVEGVGPPTERDAKELGLDWDSTPAILYVST